MTGTIARLVLLGLFSAAAWAQGPDWKAWQFLIGDWTGQGGGQPGQASAPSSSEPRYRGALRLARARE